MIFLLKFFIKQNQYSCTFRLIIFLCIMDELFISLLLKVFGNKPYSLIVIYKFQPFVRREACMGLYRLCLGKTADGKTGYTLLLPTLASLLSFLEDALSIKPVKNLEVSKLTNKTFSVITGMSNCF